jgi:hypothetical protein
LFDELRGLEAKAAEDENKSIKLGGDVNVQKNVEGDGTVLRKIFVSRDNPHVTDLVKEAEQGLKRRGKLPKKPVTVWSAHIRYAAVSERGGGRISLVRLPLRLVSKHGPPPPEAFQELLNSNLLKRCASDVNLFTDGAHAWPKLVKAYNKMNKAKVCIREVKHYKSEYTKTSKKGRRGQSLIAGTQSLDQRWRWLKRYVPHGIKGKIDRRENPRLDSYVYSFQFRSNVKARGADLWTALGREVQKAKPQ